MKALTSWSLAAALACSPAAFAQQGNDQSTGDPSAQHQRDRQSAQGMQRDSMQSQSARGTANRFVIGKLVDAKTIRVTGAQGAGKHRLLKLESRSGEQIVVNMGPSRSPSAMGFRKGDLIVAMGKSARINGSPVLYAHYVGELQDLAAREGMGGGTAER